jgi:hypothetical protein
MEQTGDRRWGSLKPEAGSPGPRARGAAEVRVMAYHLPQSRPTMSAAGWIPTPSNRQAGRLPHQAGHLAHQAGRLAYKWRDV